VVTSADLISEGVDVPRVGAVILLRPTQSLGLYMQMVGRGFRLWPGKPCLFVLDHAGNVLRHGMPDAPRTWSLDGRPKRDNSAPATRQCPECWAIHAPAPSCPECGFDYAASEARAKRREIEQREGELAEMTADDRRLALLRERSLSDLVREAANYEAMDEIRRARGYKPGWTSRQMAMRGRRMPAHTRGEEFSRA
jgi:superfamily II DNA or RNA helicase